MKKLVVIAMLLLPSLTQTAAKSSTTHPAHEKKFCPQNLMARIEKLYQEQQRSLKKREQKLIATQTTQEKKNKIDQKTQQAQDLGDSLSRLWHEAKPEDDFQQLLDDSYAVLRMHTNEPDIEKFLSEEPHSDGSLLITHAMLNNAFIAQHIGNAPLFTFIRSLLPFDSYSKPYFISNDLGGYIALDSNNELYVFNCNTKTMTTIPHTSTGNKKIKLIFSYDGSTIARISYPEGADPETSYKNTVILYDSNTGTRLYAVTNIGQSLSASPTHPLFIFLDKNPENNLRLVHIYNYKTNIEYEITLLHQEDVLANTCIKISPHGTYAAFILNYTKGTTILCVSNTITKQRFYIPTKGLTSFLKRIDWHRRLHFNEDESMMILAHDNGTLHVFKTAEFKSTILQKPYVERNDYNNPEYDPHFSADGKQILVPQKNLSAYLYDLATQKKVKHFTSKIESGPFFVPQNVITLDIQSCADMSHSYTFYVPETEEVIQASSSLHFFKQRRKLAYTQPCSNVLSIRDLSKQLEYTAKKGHYKCVSDSKGKLFCINRINLSLEQLVIDPSNCTLEQLFFLLGIIHATTKAAEKLTVLSQLLRSPILATFSDKKRKHLQDFIGNCTIEPLAPPRTSITPSSLSSLLVQAAGSAQAQVGRKL